MSLEPETRDIARPVFVLDTGVLVDFMLGRAHRVTEVLEQALRGDCEALVSFITHYELAVIQRRPAGPRDRRGPELRDREALQVLSELNSLPVKLVPESGTLRWLASGFKARGSVSMGDAYILATALERGAVLLHRDPKEMSAFTEVRQEVI